MHQFHRWTLAFALLSCGAIAFAQNPFGFKAGKADAPVTGGAGPAGNVNAAPTLEKCDNPFGTIAVVEPQDQIIAALAKYNLPPPTSLLRLMIQQSNCFQVVERGMAMQNLMQERNLAASGQLQAGSNVGQGQLVTADFIMTPQVAFSESNAGGAGVAAIGSLFGTLGSVVGAVAAGVKFKQAQTTLLVADSRSGIQVAAAEGNVEKADWGVGGFLGGVGAGAYTNTAEGKVVAAALLDNYNNIVRSIRAQPSLMQARAGSASVANAAMSVQAPQPKPPGAFGSGDVIVPKIAGVKVFTAPAATSKPVLTLKKGDEMVFLGEEKDSFVKVQTSSGAGWVDRNLVTGTR
jgi:Curli production assembly/transport component CsgG